MVNLILWCVYPPMQDTFWEEDFVECISPNFIFIWIIGPYNIVESIVFLDSSPYEISDLGQVAKLPFQFLVSWSRLIRCGVWDLFLLRSPDSFFTSLNSELGFCHQMPTFIWLLWLGWGKWGSAHNEDFRHWLITLMLLRKE